MTTVSERLPASARLAAAAADLDALAHSAVPERMFFRGFLDRIVEALDAEAGAVWLHAPDKTLALACDVRLAETGLTRDPARSRQNLQRLGEAIAARGAAAHEDTLDPASGPTVTLLAPLRARRGTIGVVQVFVKGAGETDEARFDTLQFLEETTSSVSRYLEWREQAGSAAGQIDFSNRLERTLALLHGDLDSQLVAMTAANEGRTLLECDRVSLVVQRGGRPRVVAVSGQKQVNETSNLTRGMAALAAESIRTNRPIASGGLTSELPLKIEARLLEYLKTSGSRMVRIVPLADSVRPARSGEDAKRRPPVPRAFGALVIEQVADGWLTPVTAERADRFALHVARALTNARRHETVFLLPLRRLVGRLLGWLSGSALAKVIAVLVLLAGAAVALTGTFAPYRVEGAGRLMPVEQRDVFAPWDGEVAELLVGSGDAVEAGEPLLKLRNADLESQLLMARNRVSEKQQQIDALRAESDEATRRSLRPEEVVRLRGRTVQTQVELDAARLRVAALEEQVESLTVRAPIAGTVATYQIEQLLTGRPVRRGDVLLEIMDEQGDWQLEISIPEHRLGHVLAAQGGRSKEPLLVEFVLATNPEKRHEGTLARLATRAVAVAQEGTVVDARIALDRDAIPNRRIGAEAIARIDCGRKPLGYVLFGDVVEFVQKRLW